jgi:hypothetical protein
VADVQFLQGRGHVKHIPLFIYEPERQVLHEGPSSHYEQRGILHTSHYLSILIILYFLKLYFLHNLFCKLGKHYYYISNNFDISHRI